MAAAEAMARHLAAKSPLALRSTKAVMVRRHSARNRRRLEHVAMLNVGVLFSRDMEEALAAISACLPPAFPD